MLARLRFVEKMQKASSIRQWNEGKLKSPPAAVKQKKVTETAKEHFISHMVETGTYMGDMVAATRNIFFRIDSIELNKDFYNKAQQRFKSDRHIHLWQGDSPDILRSLVKEFDHPILFWLDAHYSGGQTARSEENGDTPIGKELEILFSFWNPKSVILIDDARLFVGKDNYPTIESLIAMLAKLRPGLSVTVAEDIIKIAEAK